MAPSFNPGTADGLKALNDYLLTRSYISGYQASRDDLAVYVAFTSAPAASYPHVVRWYNHITALLGSSFPGKAEGVTVAGATSAPAAAAAPAKPAAAAPPAKKAPVGSDSEDDDDLDLFGELTEEEKAAKAEKDRIIAEAKARGAEKAALSKSMIILDVKPWDDTTDLAQMETYVRSIEVDGLLWGSAKLVPIGFGIKKLQITAVVQDSKVPSFDAIIEDHLVQDGENELIQSADIVAFNKL